MTIGGTWAVAVCAAFVTCVLQVVLSALNRRGLPAFFQQFAGAAIATAFALALLVAGPHLPDWVGRLPPSLVVGSGIVVLLAGSRSSGPRRTRSPASTARPARAPRDGPADDRARPRHRRRPRPRPARRHRPQPDVLQRGVLPPRRPGRRRRRGRLHLGRVGVRGPARGPAGRARRGHRRLRRGRGDPAGHRPVAAAGLAALLVGLLAEGTAWRWGVPGLVVSVCGIVPLLPGLAIYRAIFSIVGGGTSAGLAQLVTAFGTALALAAGVTLGEFCSQPLRREFDRIEQRVRRRSLNRQF